MHKQRNALAMITVSIDFKIVIDTVENFPSHSYLSIAATTL